MTGGRPPMPRAEAAALLDVPQDAGADVVQHAFLRAARRVHPDVLTGADEDERREAAEAFDRLQRARAALLTGGTATPPHVARPGDPAGPRYRRVEGRGLGGSLVVLALLAFLLVALVTVQQGLRGDPVVGIPGPPATSAPQPS